MSPPSLPKLLFIDDEESILSAFKRLFRKEGFEVFTTSKPDEAFELVSQHAFSVVVSDQRMPIMEGVAVLTKVRELAPQSVRIMLTGYADLHSAINAVNSGNIFRFLTKPWNDEELKGAIRQAERQYALILENERLQSLTAKQNLELIAINSELEERVKKRTAEVSALNKRLELSFLECVKVMGGIAEASGSLPSGHAKRVARLAGEVAKHLGFDRSESLDVQIAGFLHDIGKIGLRSEDLAQHPVRGAEIARMVPSLDNVSRIILHHHDRFDQKGSAHKGSMILSVADAYDKLLYSEKSGEFSTPAKVMRLLEERCTGEFSPQVVQALLKHLEQSGQLDGVGFEIEIGLYDLKTDMVLSRAIHFKDGRLVLGADFTITREILDKLWAKHLETPVVNEVFVYRKPKVGKV